MAPLVETDEEQLGFEERADQLSEEQLRNGTVVQDYFDDVQKALLARGLVLIVGPRGCGKTHMMRYAALVCRDTPSAPFAVYVSFNRYLRLEPLLGARPDAMSLFHAWVLGRILISAIQTVDEITGTGAELTDSLELEQGQLIEFVDRMERGMNPSAIDERVATRLSVAAVAEALRSAAAKCGRKRIVVLLDDAALTLTPEFLVEFFDVVRVLKANDIAPKASVYPGTTEYGPRFHADHEGRSVPVWLPVADDRYVEVMKGIALSRYPESRIVADDVDRTLMYAAFGVPRAYLTLLREWVTRKGSSEQADLNRIIQDHRDARVSEYRSLALKLPKLATLIKTGESLFTSMVEVVREANTSSPASEEKQLLVAIPVTNFDPLSRRMINLLVEAGLVREEAEVSHGKDRRYRRFAPHVGALIAARAFGSGRGGGARLIVEGLSRPLAKHPVRRSLNKLILPEQLRSLKLDLPPCQNCNAERLNDGQRFCQSCGTKLLADSTFSRCMKLSIDEVPGISAWARKNITDLGFVTIGDLMSAQDPGTELRRIRFVGEVRSGRILAAINSYIDEFLS